MRRTNDILMAAKQRADQLRLPYSGAVTPDEAGLPAAKPAVCQTGRRAQQRRMEFRGHHSGAVNIEWKTFPGMIADNPNFLTPVASPGRPRSLVLFICRSGVRSDGPPAPPAHGFNDCFNVLEGFEGDKNTDHHHWQGQWLESPSVALGAKLMRLWPVGVLVAVGAAIYWLNPAGVLQRVGWMPPAPATQPSFAGSMPTASRHSATPAMRQPGHSSRQSGCCAQRRWPKTAC